MLIKVFSTGQGAGLGPIEYVCSQNPFGHRHRSTPPRILKGDPILMRLLIDVVPFRWKYSSGVLSFALGDNPTDSQLTAVIDDFERLVFAGLPMSSRSILWVLHEEGGRKELHFIIPRQEVHTGKSFNGFAPGWEKKFDLLRNKYNFRYGWARPDDPRRARQMQPGTEALIRADAKRQKRQLAPSVKEVITEKLVKGVERGEIKVRNDIITALQNMGYELPRIGKDYITILEPTYGKRTRLKGTLFQEGFSAAKWHAQIAAKKNIVDEPNPEKAAQAAAALERAIAKVADYNLKRYRLGHMIPSCLPKQANQPSCFVKAANASGHNGELIAVSATSPPSSLVIKMAKKIPAMKYMSKAVFHTIKTGRGMRDVRYVLSRFHANLRWPQIDDGRLIEPHIAWQNHVFPLAALKTTAGVLSWTSLMELDKQHWQQFDEHAAQLTDMVHWDKMITAKEYVKRLQQMRAFIATRQLEVIYPKLKNPIEAYRAIKKFFCPDLRLVPAWLAMQGLCNERYKLGRAIAYGDDLELHETKVLINQVQALDVILHPENRRPSSMQNRTPMMLSATMMGLPLEDYAKTPEAPIFSRSWEEADNAVRASRHIDRFSRTPLAAARSGVEVPSANMPGSCLRI